MSDATTPDPTTERYLAWGWLATGGSLIATLLADVLGGAPWFVAVVAVGGALLVALGLTALLLPAHRRARFFATACRVEPALFGVLLASGADEDVGYVIVLSMLMLLLAAVRGRRAHRTSLVVAVGAEVVRQVLHPVVGQRVEPLESVIGLGLAVAVSSVLAALVERVRASEDEARRALREAERAATQLDVLHRVVASTIGANESEALQQIVTEIGTYLDVPAASVFLVGPDGVPYVSATSDPAVMAVEREAAVAQGPFRTASLGRALDEGAPARSTVEELAETAASGLPVRGDATVHPLRRASGRVVGALACATPVGRRFTDTEIRTIARFADQTSLAIEAARALDGEAELAAQYRELDRLKTDFVAITSHELRTPLTTVVGVVETLRRHLDELGPEDLGRLVGALERQTQRISRLVDDLRTVSRVDAGTLTILPRPTDVGGLVREAALQMPQVDTRVEVADDLPLARTDPDRLTQVLVNLLANGEQHGQGPVHVVVDLGDGQVVVRVWDDGPGVPHDRREEVFDRFVRLGDTNTHSRGTGLGLAIARELTVAMGGTIEVVDRGRGRTGFEVRLPLDPVPAH